jgi:hypothetical protein
LVLLGREAVFDVEPPLDQLKPLDWIAVGVDSLLQVLGARGRSASGGLEPGARAEVRARAR